MDRRADIRAAIQSQTPWPLPPSGWGSLLPPLCSEWFATSTDSYILRDLDDTSVVEDGRKKLNTLAHYKVKLDTSGEPCLLGACRADRKSVV